MSCCFCFGWFVVVVYLGSCGRCGLLLLFVVLLVFGV